MILSTRDDCEIRETGEITLTELEAKFHTFTLRQLCFEAADLAELIAATPNNQLLNQIQSWIAEATESKVDGYCFTADSLKNDLELWKRKKDHLMEMCDQIIERKESELDAMKQGLIKLEEMGLVDSYLVGKTRAIEIRDNSRPKITLKLSPDDPLFPDQFKESRTRTVALTDEIVAAHTAGQNVSAIADVTFGKQVRFKLRPKTVSIKQKKS
ncbi:MAG TPA: hypothetical protein DCY91_19195 [Cyanobacteria bacterium UBA11370]|nr:hypothetical protein [Cyanobacteria bacterium UBA11370]HBY81140.1 hypothetical protein [Cyanobacteria bacterium UBA11148]